MNEETTKLIQQLAEKFGTTAEHLWNVLVRQAPISAGCDILISIASVLIAYWFFRLIHIKTTDTEEKEADWKEEGAFVAWLLLGLFIVITSICILGSIEGVVSGFVNPEYWALKQFRIIK